ncbi:MULTISPECIES: 30S ribosomal protein S8 [Desulfosporosinus]|uniref:30S ribosomal protein S8 n=1 Tax=Desulfosporosinus TaxID=79206 RepID=UPI0027EF4F25|nr:30S ribosomal protein S8 [Desulfosporosinus sp. PR]MDQ7094119.1 30S ribosomal protein S8 [Desulfosporosinus sp. PR]
MSMSDPIADFLTRIRNAGMVYHDKVEVPSSRIKKELAELLKAEGYIKDVEYIADDKQGVIRMYLKYGPNRERVITGLKRISRPGLRVYAKKDEIPKVLGGLGVAVISTSKGIMTDRKARKEGLGGEVISYIW